MATDNSLRVTELDFLSIRENLKNFLRSQDEFQDFDFEGSGMAVLLDLLAYNTHYMAYYLNMVGNEMFLDSAQLRSSLLSHAKYFNYTPTSRRGSQAAISLLVTPTLSEDPAPDVLVLDKYTRFLGTDKEGVNYTFLAENALTVSKVGGSFTFENVSLRQGEVITRQFLMTPTNLTRRFELPSENIDTSTLIVNVQNSSTDLYTMTYSLASDITELTKDSPVYFLEENENLTYTIYFGDDVISRRPSDGSIIICTYLDTSGTAGDSITRFVPVDSIGGKYKDNVAVTIVNSSYGGAEKETIDQIRFRAPNYYTTQNRAVTTKDYELLLLKDYPNIDSVSVWGGEDNDPVVYGKVFISLKTKSDYVLTNYEKEDIKAEIIRNRNVLTVSPEIVDPDYVYLLIDGKVYFDPTRTTLTSGQLRELVRAAIRDYNSSDLNTFTSVFKKSKLQSYIDTCEKSITGSDVKIYVQKRVAIDTVNTKNYTINFNLPLLQGAHENRLYTFPEIVVKDPGGTSRDSFIEEVPEALTGIQYISIVDGGRNYTIPPTVTISGDGTGAVGVARIVGGRVVAVEISNPGTNYSYANVSLDSNDGGTGASAIIKLQSKVGRLRTFYYKDVTGEKVIISNDAGTIDYDTGIVQLSGLRALEVVPNDFYDTNYLTVNIQIRDSNIYPLRNRILTIDQDDSRSTQIEMVAE